VAAARQSEREQHAERSDDQQGAEAHSGLPDRESRERRAQQVAVPSGRADREALREDA
jgi:hypothetical protein